MGRMPLHALEARRILLIKPSALGDIVHALPVLTGLRRRYPLGHITWLVNRSYQPLLEDHPDLDTTLTFDRSALGRGLETGVRDYVRFVRDLRSAGFDLAIDLQGLLRSGLWAALSGAPRRVGLATAREGAAWFYTDVIPVPRSDTLHAVDRYWLVAEALGVDRQAKQFRLAIGEPERSWAQEVLRNFPRPWMVVAVGARWATKRWPPDHFAALLRLAQSAFAGTALFIGGGEDRSLAQSVAARLSGPVQDLTGRTSLPQLKALFSLADVVVGNDTGPLHLAVALGRSVVAPYTCTNISLTGPYGQSAHAVATGVPCYGSRLRHCRSLQCLGELTPDRLWPVLKGILNQWESTSRSA